MNSSSPLTVQLIQPNLTCSKVDLWFLALSLSYKVIHTFGRCRCFVFPTFSHQVIIFTKDLEFLFRIFEKLTTCSTAWTVNGCGVDLIIFLPTMSLCPNYSMSPARPCSISFSQPTLFSPCPAVATTPICLPPNVILSSCSASVILFEFMFFPFSNVAYRYNKLNMSTALMSIMISLIPKSLYQRHCL